MELVNLKLSFSEDQSIDIDAGVFSWCSNLSGTPSSSFLEASLSRTKSEGRCVVYVVMTKDHYEAVRVERWYRENSKTKLVSAPVDEAYLNFVSGHTGTSIIKKLDNLVIRFVTRRSPECQKTLQGVD